MIGGKGIEMLLRGSRHRETGTPKRNVNVDSRLDSIWKATFTSWILSVMDVSWDENKYWPKLVWYKTVFSSRISSYIEKKICNHNV